MLRFILSTQKGGTKSAAGSMKWYHTFITYINYDVAISGQKLYLTMQWRYKTPRFHIILDLHECSIRIYLTGLLQN